MLQFSGRRSRGVENSLTAGQYCCIQNTTKQKGFCYWIINNEIGHFTIIVMLNQIFSKTKKKDQKL